MTRTIKLEDKTYKDLEELRLKSETFSQAVDRLIAFKREISGAVWRAEAGHARVPDQPA